MTSPVVRNGNPVEPLGRFGTVTRLSTPDTSVPAGSVGTLQTELELDSGGTSQHLAALRRIGLVASRRDGNSVFYRVDDEAVFDLLAAGRAIISRRLATEQSILHALEAE